MTLPASYKDSVLKRNAIFRYYYMEYNDRYK